MHRLLIYDLTSHWYDVVEYFKTYMPVTDSNIVLDHDSHGNKPVDLAVVWLANYIAESTGAIDTTINNRYMDINTRLAVMYADDNNLVKYKDLLNYTVIPNIVTDANINIWVKKTTLYIRMQINGC